MGRNQLSFSFSRYGTFTACPRQYYLNYYGCRNGWFQSSSKEAQNAYFLKKLTNIYAWAGNIAHESIEYALKSYRDNKKIPTIPELLNRAKALMKKQYKESQERVQKHKEGEFKAYKLFGLLEHEYHMSVTPEKRKSIWERVRTCLNNFFSSQIYQDIINSDTSEWKSIEEFSTFPIKVDGYSIDTFSVPDFAMKKDGKIWIYDWKTGKENAKYNTQLSMYAIYASAYWGVKPQDVVCKLYYLLLDKVVPIKIDADVLDKTTEEARTAIKSMIQKLRDKDPVRNDPIDISNFPITADSKPCFFCQFKRICGKY